MNERIKELAEQAGVKMNAYGRPIPASLASNFDELAQLIVWECAALAKSKSEHIEEIETEDHDDQIHLRSLSWQFEEFGYEIKKHFGVEE